MSGPNESSLNVQILKQTLPLHKNIEEICENLEEVEVLTISGNKTYVLDSSPPSSILGDSGDFALYEKDSIYQVWFKVGSVWELLKGVHDNIVTSNGQGEINIEGSVQITNNVDCQVQSSINIEGFVNILSGKTVQISSEIPIVGQTTTDILS